MPTPPDQVRGQLTYNRVAGIQKGSCWEANLVDLDQNSLTIPQPCGSFSDGISTVRVGTLRTDSVQAATVILIEHEADQRRS